MNNKTISYALVVIIFLRPLSVSATNHNFAWQWPLVLSEPDAGAYQVVLDASVYQAAYWNDWRDIQVLDADNKPVHSQLYPASKITAPLATQYVELSWFPLPLPAKMATDLSTIVQRDNNGRVTTIHNATTTAATAHSPAWLIDSDQYRGQLQALHVEWADPEAILDVGFRLEASDDLRQWQVIVAEARLLQLRNGQQHLRNNRIALTTSQRYLRLLPLKPNIPVPPLHTLRAEIIPPVIETTDWQWLELSAEAEHEPGSFEYRMRGRFPIQRLDIQVPPNTAATWRVFSRDQAQQHWKEHYPHWDTWQLNTPTQRSPPLDMPALLSHQQWRLQPISTAPLPEAPRLRLGWQPGTLLFLAQGRPPYVLVAGSATFSIKPNADSNVLTSILNNLRQHYGQHWQPVTVSLGKATPRAGEAAYQIPAQAINWNIWLLWGVLIIGVLIVARLAINLTQRIPISNNDSSEHGSN